MRTLLIPILALCLMCCEKERPEPTGPPPTPPVDTIAPCDAPPTPGFITPLAGAVMPMPLYFQWVDVGAYRYILQVEMTWTNSWASIHNGWVYDTRKTIETLPPIPNPASWPNGQGRWRVLAACEDGTQGEFTQWRQFTISP